MTVEQLIERVWNAGEAMAPWLAAGAVAYGVFFLALFSVVIYHIIKVMRSIG